MNQQDSAEEVKKKEKRTPPQYYTLYECILTYSEVIIIVIKNSINANVNKTRRLAQQVIALATVTLKNQSKAGTLHT